MQTIVLGFRRDSKKAVLLKSTDVPEKEQREYIRSLTEDKEFERVEIWRRAMIKSKKLVKAKTEIAKKKTYSS